MLALQMSHEPTLKPMPVWVALIYFGASAVVFKISIYALLPFFINAGLVLFWAFLVSYGLVLSLMMVASLIAFKREGYPLTLRAFSKRSLRCTTHSLYQQNVFTSSRFFLWAGRGD
jgi:hypothetical protein